MELLAISKRELLNALWQAYYHCQLTNLDDIDGNDHPRLLKLTDDIFERLKDESPLTVNLAEGKGTS